MAIPPKGRERFFDFSKAGLGARGSLNRPSHELMALVQAHFQRVRLPPQDPRRTAGREVYKLEVPKRFGVGELHQHVAIG